MSNFAFIVAGVNFRLDEFHKASVQEGDEITLTPEPTNPHDPSAIAVLKGDLKIGYVPRRLNKDILVDMQAGPCTCKATGVRGNVCSVLLETPAYEQT